MTPVISPWVFYLMPVCEKFSVLSWIIFGLITFSWLTIGFIYLSECEYADEISRFKRVLKTLLVLMIITALLACLIPTERTITKMIVAQNVTVERVATVSDTVVTVYNDIMNLFRDSGAANG